MSMIASHATSRLKSLICRREKESRYKGFHTNIHGSHIVHLFEDMSTEALTRSAVTANIAHFSHYRDALKLTVKIRHGK